MPVQKVVFACVHNAGRSQMAAAFFNQAADAAKAVAISAGIRPGPRVHAEVRDAMREIGIDISLAYPQLLTAELARGAKLLITMAAARNAHTSQAWNAPTGRCRIRRAAHSRRFAPYATTSAAG